MRNIFFLILLSLFFNCSLIEPVNLLIQNDSSYDIEVSFDKGEKTDINIESGKGDFVLFFPGEVKMNIRVPEIGFNRDYSIKLKYLNKIKFIFDIQKSEIF